MKITGFDKMKLKIRHKYFEDIKLGLKKFEYRDAHITFIDEETNEEIKKYVKSVNLILESFSPKKYRGKGLFDDEKVIQFELF